MPQEYVAVKIQIEFAQIKNVVFVFYQKLFGFNQSS